ncbi:hypothetical protein [Halorubellus sp. PRR65]|uniref:hypothetical protein n=1 Tax=Halorubellus sp. PRR65 TaxID=3098148 RepID=UPI002B256652|nr:hypothetical protein [Halorubellus sp. PRR65]
MNAKHVVAAVLAVLVVGAGAVAATPAASPVGQTAADVLPGDDHAANESDDAGASDSAPPAAEPDDDGDEAADDDDSEADAEPGANAPVDVPTAGANDRSLPAQASDTARTVQSTIADWFGANESDREHDSLGDAISSVVGGDDAEANASATGQSQASSNANDEGVVHAVVSFLTSDDADA